MRGGLPPGWRLNPALPRSLPRARGFTVYYNPTSALVYVSPPCAGVYRNARAISVFGICLSPVRGGLPVLPAPVRCGWLSLPRARGFTDQNQPRADDFWVSPPCAGVYRGADTEMRRGHSLSPVRGGLPRVIFQKPTQVASLPRARGFTECHPPVRRGCRVSPPCAGFYRT